MTNTELYKVTLRDTTFHLDRSQIEFDSPNYFTSCFLGSFAESNARAIRLSRDPALFSIIVSYLSGYTIFPLQAVEGMAESAVLENLLADALFYGLDELADVLEEYRAGKKAMRRLEEQTVKSYFMVVWPVRIVSPLLRGEHQLNYTRYLARNGRPQRPIRHPNFGSPSTQPVQRSPHPTGRRSDAT